MISVIDLPRQIDANLAADIEKEAAFVSPYLRRLRVGSERDTVEIEVSERVQETAVHDKVERFLDAMLKRTHCFETKVFLRTERGDAGPYEVNVHQELVRRGWVFDYGHGHVAMTGPALALADLIDGKAAELYRRHFDAEGGHYPAFVNAEILKRCGYFDSHPNAVSLVGHVIEDFDAIESFRAANSCAEGVVLPESEQVHMPGLCLNPAACFPCYPTLAGQSVPEAGKAMTWRGRVFRYESRNLAGLDRLWEFSVRELVFVGSDRYVGAARERAIPLIGELAATFDLECQVETANDPFFATVAAARTFWQRSQEVKNEIMLTLEPGLSGARRKLACGSINLHGRFFGDRFDITSADAEAAATGCIGLGIERWVFAAFSQHGFDPERWPAAVRNEIFG
jgi:seryl-tRNA synthetase